MLATFKSLRNSLRGRLLFGTFIWLFILILIAGWGFSNLFDNQAKQRLSFELDVYMNQLIADFSVDHNGVMQLDFNLDEIRFNAPYSGIYWQIDKINTDGSMEIGVLRSRSLWDVILKVPADISNTEQLLEIEDQINDDLYIQSRVIKPAEVDADYRFIIAMDQNVLEPALNQFKFFLAIFLGLLALAVVLGVLLQIVLSLRPLVLLRRELSKLAAGDSDQIVGDFPSEIQPLVTAFNDVLKTNSAMVEQARTQAGNLAHALKTPLAILANSTYGDNSELARLVASQVQQAQQHVNHHLSRSRAMAIGHSQSVSSPVAPVIASLVNTMQHLYANKDIAIWVNTLPDSWFFGGTSADLQEILGNVLENAYKWAKTNIWITVDLQDKKLLVSIEDDGMGLTAGQLQQLFQRGIRLDEKTPGTGLGLSIVQDLVDAYKGKVTATGSAHGGLAVKISLPGANKQ